MPRLGFMPQTPRESTSPIVTFAHKDAERLTKRLAAAKVDVRIADYWVRIAPSVYNDMADIERLRGICPRLATNYGMTETTSAITIVEPTDEFSIAETTAGLESTR